jgi:uncharacterized membrane protein YeaQ/YmgE (transglycosylase-associated protein family)
MQEPMIASVNVNLLCSIPGWIGIGLFTGRLAHVVLVRRGTHQPRPDLPVALILGLVGATIGGAVGWSMHGALNAVLASLLSATLGAVLLCILFQFIVPV